MPRRLPLFPLGTVVTPGMVLPLHIFEPRYRLLVRTLVAKPEHEREFVIAAIRQGSEVGGHPEVYSVGTTVTVSEVEPLSDGRYNLLVVGTKRVRLGSIDRILPYDQVMVTDLLEPAGESDLVSLGAIAGRRYLKYRAVMTQIGLIDQADAAPELPEDPTALSYLITATTVMDLPARQRLLEVADTTTRLETLCDVLHDETKLLRHLASLPSTMHPSFDTPSQN